jgi:hypothetical protein
MIYGHGNRKSIATATNEAAVHTSFDIAQITAKKLKSFTDG